MNRYLLILLSVLLFTANSFADRVTLSIHSTATAIPQKLIDNGIQNVGPLNLQQLVDDIKNKVKFAVLPVFSIGSGTYGSHRSGSSCRVEEHSVFVNQPHLDNLGNLEVIEALLLHESLCALGYNDDNYMISSTLGSLRKLSKKTADGGASEAEKLISNPGFMSPFIRKLGMRTKNLRYTFANRAQSNSSTFLEDKKTMLASGGTVTGVGGGGDGFALYLKMQLFDKFWAFYSLCEQHPSESRVSLPQKENLGIEIDLICVEPRQSTWWNYFFSLSVETAYMRASSNKSIEYPQEYPALGSFILEPQEKFSPYEEIAPIKITIDSYRWNVAFNLWRNDSSEIVFLTMMLNYYNPTTNSKAIQHYPVFEFKGKKEYIDAVTRTFNNATATKCTDPSPRDEMNASFSGIPLPVYLSNKTNVPENQLHEPPNCLYLVD
ncbi:MAG: hypothetical protein ACXVCL_19265 [Bdellovibrio sp.]